MAADMSDTKLPPTNKSLIFDTTTQNLHVDPSRPVPTLDPSKGDHLIHVKTTALCKGELDWPALFPDNIFSENPDRLITPGYDVAGTVVTAPQSSPFHPGDEIYARTLPSRPGNYREFTVVRTTEMALKPKKLSWAEAASVPLSALSAWQALFDHARVQGLHIPNSKVKKILVLAAAGGVGTWLVQLARIAGLEVVAQVGSADNDRFIRQLGANETVNYKMTSLKDWTAANGPVDIVFDLIGGKTLADAWYSVKINGKLISIVEPPEGRRPEELEGKDVENEFFIMKPDGQQLTEISKLIDEGQCRATVDSVWDFKDYQAAFEKLQDGHARGKIVVNVNQ